MASLDNPWIVQDGLFLRTDQANTAVRLPSPPVLMTSTASPPACGLILFRYPTAQLQDADSRGGAVLWLVFDLGAPIGGRELLETQLPAEVSEVGQPVLSAGTIRLWLGPAQIGSAVIPAGVRPIISVSATVDVNTAVLLRNAVEAGEGILVATAEAGIVVQHTGPRVEIEIDPRRAQQALDMTQPVAAKDAAAMIAGMLADGTVQVELSPAEAGSTATNAITSALVANEIFEPAPAGPNAWSVLPGVSAPGYEPQGMVRPRAVTGDGPRRLVVGERQDVVVPWFGSALVQLPTSSVQQLELAGSSIVGLQIYLMRALPPDLSSLSVEVEVGGVDVGSVSFEAGGATGKVMKTLRFMPPAGWDHTYRWRIRLNQQDGTSSVGAWEAANGWMIVVDQQAQ